MRPPHRKRQPFPEDREVSHVVIVPNANSVRRSAPPPSLPRKGGGAGPVRMEPAKQRKHPPLDGEGWGGVKPHAQALPPPAAARKISATVSAAITSGRLSSTSDPPMGMVSPSISPTSNPMSRSQLLNVARFVFEPIIPT